MMMQQVVTGIQTTGSPHLGNIVGAVRPAMAAGSDSRLPPIYIVADMHSMLSVRDQKLRKESTIRVTAVWMAFGADDIGLMYRQSHIPQLSEIALLLSGTASMATVMEGPLKSDVFSNIHPVLMSADLLMLGTTHIPVGQDSIPHIEMVRDTAFRFNEIYGDVLTIPSGLIDMNRPTLPGIDGQKMSKSFDNVIDVMDNPDRIRSRVKSMSEIVTIDRDGIFPNPCDAASKILWAINKELFPTSRIYPAGSAKKVLEEYLIEEFQKERDSYSKLMLDPGHLLDQLKAGEARVLEIAEARLHRMREAMGMS